MWFEELARNNQLILKTGSCNNIPGNAVFNENGTRRYFLEKRWAGPRDEAILLVSGGYPIQVKKAYQHILFKGILNDDNKLTF